MKIKYIKLVNDSLDGCVILENDVFYSVAVVIPKSLSTIMEKGRFDQ